MTSLSVNLNKVALVRNTRTNGIPDLAHLAQIALAAEADGITVHPRPDGRHVRGPDVVQLAALVAAWPGAEFNVEGNPFHQLMDYVREVRPHQCTFVPDDTGAFTSDHGWDLARDGAKLRPLVAEAHALGVRVSLFMDPDPALIPAAAEIGADRIELYTEPYAKSFGGADQAAQVQRYRSAAQSALACGLGVNAGHDLNLANLGPFLAAVPGVLEVSIGHALIADALEFGLEETVRRYRAVIHAARAGGRAT